MSAISESPITHLLGSWQQGDERALEELMPLVYEELARLARRYLRRESAGHTLETRDLIHDAFLRLLDQRRVDWQSRAHFFAIAAQTMRRILVDHARRRRYVKHGGVARRLSLAEIPDLRLESDEALLALDEALGELERADATLARVVELRFFGGLDHDEIAAALQTSRATARRRWQFARTWLYRRLRGPEAPPPR